MLKVVTARLHPPKPSTQRFDGLTILLVGASGGIGLEAAKKLVGQGTSILIITARDEAKAQRAKEAIFQHFRSLPAPHRSPTIIPLVVEMTSPASIHRFVASLGQSTGHLDHAIISAGVLPGKYEQLDTSFEGSLQVNAISPSLLSLLLFPFLLASSLVAKELVSERPHLTLVSSGAAWLTSRSSISSVMNVEHPLRELSKKEAFPPGMMGGQIHYCRTKLMLEYSMRHISGLPSITNSDGQPKVLVCSVCPGAVNSDLSRYSAGSGFLGAMARVVNNTVARTAEQGCNIYISSLSLGAEGRGEMWTDDHIVTQDHRKYIQTQVGRAFGERVWDELKAVMLQMDAAGGQGVVTQMLGK
ncbi:hypothetical protein F4679DRAFT_509984 [Xylaria curta]|nr:hypothetical protein F4679DRAFT_509984 [Xylaria curta]